MKKILSIMILMIFSFTTILNYYPNIVNAETNQSLLEDADDINPAPVYATIGKNWQDNNQLKSIKNLNGKTFKVKAHKSGSSYKEGTLTTHYISKNGLKQVRSDIAADPNYAEYLENCMGSSTKGNITVTAPSGVTKRTLSYAKTENAKANQKKPYRALLPKNKKFVYNESNFFEGTEAKLKGLSALYKNPTTYNGTKINIKVTIKDIQLSNNSRCPVGISFTKHPGIICDGVDSVVLSYEFLNAETSKAITCKGYGQLYDIDAQQGVRFDRGVEHVFLGADGNKNIPNAYAWNGVPYVKNNKTYYYSQPPARKGYKNISYLGYNPTDANYLYVYAPTRGETTMKGNDKLKTGLVFLYNSPKVEMTYTFAQGYLVGEGPSNPADIRKENGEVKDSKSKSYFNYQNGANSANGLMYIMSDPFKSDSETQKGIIKDTGAPVTKELLEQAFNTYDFVDKTEAESDESKVNGPNSKDETEDVNNIQDGQNYLFVVKGTYDASTKAKSSGSKFVLGDEVPPQFEVTDYDTYVYNKNSKTFYNANKYFVVFKDKCNSLDAMEEKTTGKEGGSEAFYYINEDGGTSISAKYNKTINGTTGFNNSDLIKEGNNRLTWEDTDIQKGIDSYLVVKCHIKAGASFVSQANYDDEGDATNENQDADVFTYKGLKWIRNIGTYTNIIGMENSAAIGYDGETNYAYLGVDGSTIQFKVRKEDGTTHQGLSGAEFTITQENSVEVATVITGADGTATTDKIQIDPANVNKKFTITESKAPDGYKEPQGNQAKFYNIQLGATTAEVSAYDAAGDKINDKSNASVVLEGTDPITLKDFVFEFQNNMQEFDVIVEKYAAENINKKLARHKFALYDQTGTIKYRDLEDKGDGTYTATGISPADPGKNGGGGGIVSTYMIREDSATATRENGGWSNIFTLSEESEYRFNADNNFPVNPHKRGTIAVEKTDKATGKPLAGALFEVTAAEDIKASDYVSGPDLVSLGYDVKAPKDIKKASGNANTIASGTVVTGSGQQIKAGTVVGYMITNADGKAELANQEVKFADNTTHTVKPLYPGKYKVTEIEAPVDYLLSDPSSQTVELKTPTTEEGTVETVTVKFANPQIDPRIGVSKIADKTVIYKNNAISSKDAAYNKNTGKYDGTKLVKTYEAGDQAAYTVKIINNGNVDLYNIDVKDYLEDEFAGVMEAGSNYFTILNNGNYKTAMGKDAKVTYADGTSNYIYSSNNSSANGSLNGSNGATTTTTGGGQVVTSVSSNASNNATSGGATPSGNASTNAASMNSSVVYNYETETKTLKKVTLNVTDYGVAVDAITNKDATISIAGKNDLEGVEFLEYAYTADNHRYIIGKTTVKNGKINIATSKDYVKYQLVADTELKAYDLTSLVINLEADGSTGTYTWGTNNGTITSSAINFNSAVQGKANTIQYMPVTNYSNLKIDKLGVGDSIEVTYLVTFNKTFKDTKESLVNTIKAVGEYVSNNRVSLVQDSGSETIKLIRPGVAVSKIASRTTGATWNPKTGRFDGEKVAGQYLAVDNGEEVEFRIDATNTGNVTLYNTTVTDTPSPELLQYMTNGMFFDFEKSKAYNYSDFNVEVEDTTPSSDATSGNASNNTTNTTSGNASGNASNNATSGNGTSGNASVNPSGNATSGNASTNASPVNSDIYDKSIAKMNKAVLNDASSGATATVNLSGETYADYQLTMGVPSQKLPDTAIEYANLTTKLGKTVTVYKLSDTQVLVDKLEPGDSVALCLTGTLNKEAASIKEAMFNEVNVTAEYLKDSEFVGLIGEKDEDSILVLKPSVEIAKVADKTTGVTFNSAIGKYDGDKITGIYTPTETAVYKITATNTGDCQVKNIKITDTLSDELLNSIDADSQAWGFINETGAFDELGSVSNSSSMNSDDEDMSDADTDDMSDFDDSTDEDASEDFSSEDGIEFNNNKLNADETDEDFETSDDDVSFDDSEAVNDEDVSEESETEDSDEINVNDILSHSTFFTEDYLPYTIADGVATATTALGDTTDVTVNDDGTLTIEHLNEGDFLNVYYRVVIKSTEDLVSNASDMNSDDFEADDTDDELSSDDDALADDANTDDFSDDFDGSDDQMVEDEGISFNADEEDMEAIETSDDESIDDTASEDEFADEEDSDDLETNDSEAYSALDELPNTVTVTAQVFANDESLDITGTPDEDKIAIQTPGIAVEKVANKTTDKNGDKLVFNEKTGYVDGVKTPGSYKKGNKVDFTLYITNTSNTKLYNIKVTDSESKELLYALQNSGKYKKTKTITTAHDNKAKVTYKDKVATIDQLEAGDYLELHYKGKVKKNPLKAKKKTINKYSKKFMSETPDEDLDSSDDISDSSDEDITDDTDMIDEESSDDFGDDISEEDLSDDESFDDTASDNEDVNFDEEFVGGGINTKKLNDDDITFDDEASAEDFGDDEAFSDDDTFGDDASVDEEFEEEPGDEFNEDTFEDESDDESIEDADTSDSETNEKLSKNVFYNFADVSAQYLANGEYVTIHGIKRADGIKMKKKPNKKHLDKHYKTGDAFRLALALAIAGAGVATIGIGYVVTRRRKYRFDK